MDNTTLTILGMIAAFITATCTSFLAFITACVTVFFAEPIKTHYEIKNKLKRLKEALYEELLFNYFSLHWELIYENKDISENMSAELISMRTECYKQALENDVILFYQLEYATQINSFYMILNHLKSMPVQKSYTIEVQNQFKTLALGFENQLAAFIQKGHIEKEFVTNKMSQKTYQELIERGKKYNEKDSL